MDGITKFDQHNKIVHPNPPLLDIPPFLIGINNLAKKLLGSKPKPDYKRFINLDNACEELHLHDAGDQNGQDLKWAENVDIFFVWSHGNNDGSNALITYNNNKS